MRRARASRSGSWSKSSSRSSWRLVPPARSIAIYCGRRASLRRRPPPHEAVLLSVLDDEGRLDLRGVAPAACALSTVGGAPGATHGCGGVAGSRHSPGTALAALALFDSAAAEWWRYVATSLDRSEGFRVSLRVVVPHTWRPICFRTISFLPFALSRLRMLCSLHRRARSSSPLR